MGLKSTILVLYFSITTIKKGQIEKKGPGSQKKSGKIRQIRLILAQFSIFHKIWLKTGLKYFLETILGQKNQQMFVLTISFEKSTKRVKREKKRELFGKKKK